MVEADVKQIDGPRKYKGKKRGRKKGSKNRPKNVVMLERSLKRIRGRGVLKKITEEEVKQRRRACKKRWVQNNREFYNKQTNIKKKKWRALKKKIKELQAIEWDC